MKSNIVREPWIGPHIYRKASSQETLNLLEIDTVNEAVQRLTQQIRPRKV